jgi:DNA polymerase III epsilon subunit-like protein
VIDIETTGLPERFGYNKYHPYTMNDKYDSSRIVQVAWRLLDADFTIIHDKNFIISRNNKFTISNSWIHGITNEISDVEGVAFGSVVDELAADLAQSRMLVAHNIMFDYNILLNELHRCQRTDVIESMLAMGQYCTATESMELMRLPIKYKPGMYKMPKLSELYEHFFGMPIENQHNAAADVDACAKCFIELIKT